MNKKQEIIEFAKSLSIDTIGFTQCRVFEELRSYFEYRKNRDLFNEFEEEDIEKKINPGLLLEGGKTIISIAFPYYYGDDEGDSLFSSYTKGEDYHKILMEYLNKICEFIIKLGGRCIPLVDSNPLPERYIATLCGIGFIGKNNTLITSKYGSYVFLGEIITDLDLEPDKPNHNNCFGCNLCMKKCPTSVIIEDGKNFNSKRCLSYLTQKKHLDNEEITLIKGKVFGCDECQKFCPHNKDIAISPIKEFEPKSYMKEVNLSELILLNNVQFKEKYKKHSCGWRGKNILIRNGLINYYYKHKTDKEEILKKVTSPYIKEYYDRLFDRAK